MIESVRTGLEECDLLLFLTDATKPLSQADREAVDLVKKSKTPALLLLNKIDQLKSRSELLPLIDQYRGLHEFAEYLPISALTGDGLDTLRSAILSSLPEGPAYFPPEHLTDQPERFLASELIREKVICETRQEVPHSVAVLIDRWQDTGKLLRLLATIYVEKEGQKGI